MKTNYLCEDCIFYNGTNECIFTQCNMTIKDEDDEY